MSPLIYSFFFSHLYHTFIHMYLFLQRLLRYMFDPHQSRTQQPKPNTHTFQTTQTREFEKFFFVVFLFPFFFLLKCFFISLTFVTCLIPYVSCNFVIINNIWLDYFYFVSCFMHNQIDVNNVVYVNIKICCCLFFRRKKNTHENWCEFKLILRWFWNGRTHNTKSNKPSMNNSIWWKNNLLIFIYSLVSSTYLQFEG